MPAVTPPSIAETPAAEPEKVTEEPAVEQEKVTEEVTDSPSVREPEETAQAVETPVAEPEVTEEDAFALDDSDTALPKKRTRKPVQEKPAKPVADDADEFGMIQPDFGF
jgi:hypothetical protein